MQYLILYFKGMIMGAADLVPGVSGGTIALITGIYEELINSINKISWNSLRKFKTYGFKYGWRKVNGSFLLSVFAGIITSIIVLSRILEWLILNESIALWSFFFGLLFASILFLISTELQYKTVSILYLLLGALISFMITQITGISFEVPLWYLFLAGFLAISAMILPGLSGAYILFIMGVYKIVLSNLRQAQDLFFEFSQEIFLQVTTVLGVFIVGIVFGIKVFARFLSWLLNKYPKKTIAFLIGLMLGALYKVWPWQNKLYKQNSSLDEISFPVFPQNYDGDSPAIVKAIAFFLIGFTLLFAIEKSKKIFEK